MMEISPASDASSPRPAVRPCRGGRSSRGVCLLLLGVLTIVSVQIACGYFVVFDRAVAGWVAALRSPMWNGSMRTITFFGSSSWTLAALGLLGWWTWRRRGGQAALLGVAAFAVGLGLEVLLRVVIVQWRPDVVMWPPSMDWQTRFGLAGFPSGHAYRSTFVFGWLMREAGPSRWAKAIRWGSLAMIVLVGFSRLYLNRHWATDVVGGWLLASLALLIARSAGRPT